jgi:aromatic ring hydroxylase-like protein
MMSGLDFHYDFGKGHPLLGRRMPDLDLVTASGPQRVFTLLHDARPVLLNFGEPGCFDITPVGDRVQLIDAKYVGTWELPAIGTVTAPIAVLIRPDGYVAWVGDQTRRGLADALTTWFGPPAARCEHRAYGVAARIASPPHSERPESLEKCWITARKRKGNRNR